MCHVFMLPMENPPKARWSREAGIPFKSVVSAKVLYLLSAERAIGMFMGMVLLGKCEQLWVFGGTISTGMAAEIEKAEKRDMVIRYFTENCEEVGC